MTTRSRYNVLKLRDVVSVKDFGAVGDGVADDSSAILQALQTAAGKTIRVPAGNYRIASVVTYSGPVSLEGESGSIFTIVGSGQLVLASAPVSIPRHSATLTAGRNSVSFLSAHTLSAGDVFVLYNTQDFSWASYRSYYRDGCMFRVDTVTNTTSVKVYGVAPDTYPTAANFLAFKLTGQGVSLKNLTINPSASTASPLVWIDGHVDVVVDNVKVKKGATNTAIELWRCFDIRIKDCDGDVGAGDSYPIILANSQKATISDCGLYSARHSIAMGGRTGDACVPTRDVLVNHCNLYNSSSNGIGAADVHGNCENIQYSDCYFNTGANVAGANVKFSNCVIVGRDPATYADGNCVYGSEIVKGVFEFEDCRFVCHGDGDNFAGFVDVYVPDRSGSITIRLKDCTGENRAASATFRCVLVGVGSGAAGTGTIGLDIQNFKLISTVAPYLFVGWAGTADVSSVASTIIDNLAAPSGTFLFGVSNSANNAMPMRMPRLSGKQQITATSGTSSTTGTAQTFRYTYPRVPIAQVTVGSSTAQTYNGNRAVFGLCSQVTASSITPWIESGDQTNWTATRTTDVMWSVEISDL